MWLALLWTLYSVPSNPLGTAQSSEALAPAASCFAGVIDGGRSALRLEALSKAFQENERNIQKFEKNFHGLRVKNENGGYAYELTPEQAGAWLRPYRLMRTRRARLLAIIRRILEKRVPHEEQRHFASIRDFLIDQYILGSAGLRSIDQILEVPLIMRSAEAWVTRHYTGGRGRVFYLRLWRFKKMSENDSRLLEVLHGKVTKAMYFRALAIAPQFKEGGWDISTMDLVREVLDQAGISAHAAWNGRTTNLIAGFVETSPSSNPSLAAA